MFYLYFFVSLLLLQKMKNFFIYSRLFVIDFIYIYFFLFFIELMKYFKYLYNKFESKKRRRRNNHKNPRQYENSKNFLFSSYFWLQLNLILHFSNFKTRQAIPFPVMLVFVMKSELPAWLPVVTDPSNKSSCMVEGRPYPHPNSDIPTTPTSFTLFIFFFFVVVVVAIN